MELPAQAQTVINQLNTFGHEAYIVGGCVRDSLLGTEPHDWDIATSALPEEIKRSLADFRLVETGIKHGTVTALVDGMPIEITTYRVDGEYSDNRHPDCVRFTGSLKDDLARRDFTINALAYNHKDGIIDCFGGKNDLIKKQIRCVGKPDQRFREDGLRILRALRFAAVLGFTVEEATAASIFKNRELLKNIASERIRTEFVKLICGKNEESVLRDYREVLEEFLPEIGGMVGFPQKNPYHIYDIWEHTLKSTAAVAPSPVLRITMLLHDIGKPLCFTQDEKGVGHFRGHNIKSVEIALAVLQRLRFDKETAEKIETLVQYHDIALLPDEKLLRRHLNRFGKETVQLLLQVKEADILAQNPKFISRLDSLKKAEEILNYILASNQCFTLKDMKINGDNLISLGFPKGKKIGITLAALLDEVMDERCPNEHGTLMNRARLMKDEII
jgi:tRNA nucleotidyltransferase/poly(A) polymerase